MIKIIKAVILELAHNIVVGTVKRIVQITKYIQLMSQMYAVSIPLLLNYIICDGSSGVLSLGKAVSAPYCHLLPFPRQYYRGSVTSLPSQLGNGPPLNQSSSPSSSEPPHWCPSMLTASGPYVHEQSSYTGP